MKKLLIAIVLLLVITPIHSQVLISIIFGDKLNSDKMVFGLMLGNGWNTLTGYSTSSTTSNFNLGLFLTLKLDRRFSIQFDALAKYKMGADELPVYSLNDHLLDSIFQHGQLERTINYLALIPTIQYRVWNNLHAELGPHIALRTKAKDLFIANTEAGELQLEKNRKASTTLFDCGVATGISWHFNKGTGVKLSARYYAGFTDMFKEETGMQSSRSVQLNVYIPVGREKAKKEKPGNDK
jgi:hypothetical protein